jgi:hypothetical protein
MQQVTLNIPDNHFPFIMKLLKAFDYIKVEKKVKIQDPPVSAEHKRILDGISEAVKEVNLHKQGKIKLQTFDEMMAEFKAEGIIP